MTYEGRGSVSRDFDCNSSLNKSPSSYAGLEQIKYTYIPFPNKDGNEYSQGGIYADLP